MALFFEATMLVCFGLSWPISIMRSWKTRTAKGKSYWFLIFALVGYISGLSGKFISGNVTYVVFFYSLNTIMVATDLVLTIRNTIWDRRAEQNAEKENAA